MLDLFAGCGGFSLGFERAGFAVTAGVEIWEPAAETFRANHPDAQLLEGDIRDVKQDLYARFPPRAFSVIIGGPPCQGYSVAGNRNPHDPRGQLYEEFLEVVAHYRPPVFVMENVKGLLSMKHLDPALTPYQRVEAEETSRLLGEYKDLKRYGAQRELDEEEMQRFSELKARYRLLRKKMAGFLVPLIDIIKERIADLGYHERIEILNAADFGVPQKRERVFIIGVKDPALLDEIFPKKTHSAAGENGTQKWVNAREVIADLANAPEDRGWSHIYMRHAPKFRERIAQVQPGHTLYKHYSDAWYRLIPEEPSRTVKENHGGVFLHYTEDRCLTPRELARLQSFPDDFRFKSTKSNVLKQIGNAVPPLLGQTLANHLKKVIVKTWKSSGMNRGSGIKS